MPCSDETRAKLIKAWEKRRASFVPPMKGKKMSEESRKKMSDAARARPSNRIGKKHTEETRRRISQIVSERAIRGADHYAWKGAQAVEQKKDRKSPGYKSWRKAVAKAAGGSCESCQSRHKGRMHAHHILGFSSHPELRLDPGNGAWLCDDCHVTVHSV